MSRIKSKTAKQAGGGKRGALFVISGLLVSSAILRIGDEAGRAMALAPDQPVFESPSHRSDEMVIESSEEFLPILTRLQAREAAVVQREAELANRMHALQIADRTVTKKLAELREAETDLRATIALADTAAEDDLARLTKVYENMKPKQAAALFEEMDPSFAAGFLGRMRPEAAAAVMAGLSAEAAHAFSVVLAGRNANVPSE